MMKPAAASETSWSCWQSNTDIHCIPDFMQPKKVGIPSARRVSNHVQTGFSEEDGWVVIPLFNHPTDWSFVELLVKSVMCGSKADCSVELNSNPMNAALLGPDN